LATSERVSTTSAPIALRLKIFSRLILSGTTRISVALLLRHQRQAEPGVAGGAFDQRRAGLQVAALLRRLDHRQADAILDRSARLALSSLRKSSQTPVSRRWALTIGVWPMSSRTEE
jgi:hypothetical protein